jgi:pSer/pThr/pTyr-binding forkhead associated (FHA) protein
MKAQLTVLAGRHAGAKIKLPKTQFIIGRAPNCHLRPASKEVSRYHCAFAQQGPYYVVRDLGSSNGTLLNDQPLHGTARLEDQDELQVGPLRFRVELINDEELSSQDNVGWLLRHPTPAEQQSLDPSDGTAELAGVPLDELRQSAAEVTVVGGQYLADYVQLHQPPVQAKHPRKK